MVDHFYYQNVLHVVVKNQDCFTGFTYIACVLFIKNKERTQKFKQTGNTDFIYKNDVGKACFQYDMAYGKHKDLNKRTKSEKVLRDKAFEIASNLKCDGYQRGLQSFS